MSPGVRLLGVGVSNLTGPGAESNEQMSLDLETERHRGSGPGRNRGGAPLGRSTPCGNATETAPWARLLCSDRQVCG